MENPQVLAILILSPLQKKKSNFPQRLCVCVCVRTLVCVHGYFTQFTDPVQMNHDAWAKSVA